MPAIAVRWPSGRMARGESIVLGKNKAATDRQQALTEARAEQQKRQAEQSVPEEPSGPPATAAAAAAPAMADATTGAPAASSNNEPEEPSPDNLQLLKSKSKVAAPAAAPPRDSPRGGPKTPLKGGISALRLLKSKKPAQAGAADATASASSPSLSRALTARLGLASSAELAAPRKTSFVPLLAALGLRKAVRVSPGSDKPATVEEAALRMRAAGKEDDWEVRYQAILALPDLLAPLAATPDAFKRAAESLCEPMRIQLSDLRSGIVRGACSVLCELATAHGAKLAALVAHVLPQLLYNLCLLKAFSNVSASTATLTLGLSPSIAAFKVLIESSKDARKQVRSGSLELLGFLFANSAFDIPPKALAAALGALSRKGGGLSDPDGSCRVAAVRCYWAIQARFPTEADAWLEKLAEKEQKLVQKHRPKLPPPSAPDPPAASTRTIPAESGTAATPPPPGANENVEQSFGLAPEAEPPEQGVSPGAPAAVASETDEKAPEG